MPDTKDDTLLRECYARSVKLLKENSGSGGIIACSRSEKAVGRQYASIFGRDAAICSLGMVLTKVRDLQVYARKSLVTLARYQAPNGQIPKYVIPESEEADFWYYGCIDATLWWLIAIHFYDSHVRGHLLRKELEDEIKLALNWLHCQEHQGLYLVQQNEASDWADIMPRSGFVLYSNALWYEVKSLYRLPGADRTRYYFNRIFFPFDKEIPEHRRARVLVHYIRNTAKKSDLFLSFVNFSYWGEEGDVFGTILALLAGVVSRSKSARMAECMVRSRVNKPFPVRTVLTPIPPGSSLWRTYMQRYRQNYPHQYHNGGIWPFIAGFWIMLLSRAGRREVAWKELSRFAEMNRMNNWEFNEWFNGRTGKPMGMAGQSWNASMFIVAYHELQGKVELFSQCT